MYHEEKGNINHLSRSERIKFRERDPVQLAGLSTGGGKGMCFPMICLQWPVAFPFPIFPGILMLAVQFLQPLEPLEPRRSRSLSQRPGAVFEAIGAESNASDAAASFSGFGKALDWMRIG